MKHFILFLSLFSLTACLETTDAVETTPAVQPEATPSAQQEAPKPPVIAAKAPYTPKRDAEFHFENREAISDAQLSEYHVQLHCTVDGQPIGAMTLNLWPEVAPNHVRRFLRYCDEGFYDGLGFHRVMRDFMIQGGCPNGIGNGDGPHGNLKAEFNKKPEYRHRYGVLSMARDRSPDTASCQFFICCEETPSVQNLDGNYTAFGILAHGIKTLEAIADLPTLPGGRGESSKPKSKVVIERAMVLHGAPLETEDIIMPEPDLGGEPAKVAVQHILISFKGAIPTATRTKEEAEKLAMEVFEKARACATDEEYTALVREFTDDNIRPGDERPGVYAMLNHKVRRDADFEAKYNELKAQFDEKQKELMDAVASGALTQQQAQAELQKTGQRLQGQLNQSKATPRGQLVPAFGNVGFKLEVGQVGLAPFHATDSKYGWHIIRRVR